jgi:hypothetical protein
LWEKAQARVAAGFGQERLRRLFTELAELRAVGRAG